MTRICLMAGAVLVAAQAARAGEPSSPAPDDVRRLHVGSTAKPAAPAAAPPVTVVLGAGSAGAAGVPALLVDSAVAAASAPSDVWSGARWVRLTPPLGRYFGAAAGVLVIEPPAVSELALESGDVITAIGGRPVSDPDELLRRLRASLPGARIVLAVLRDHARREQSCVVPAKSAAATPAAPRVPASPPVPRGV